VTAVVRSEPDILLLVIEEPKDLHIIATKILQAGLAAEFTPEYAGLDSAPDIGR
jgi:hypothetical protein